MRRQIVPAVFACLLAAARSAGACPVCFEAGDAGALWFYKLSTLWLTLLPFAVIGGTALAAYRLRGSSDH